MKTEKRSESVNTKTDDQNGVVSIHSLKSNGRRSAVHDISHVTYEECQKIILDCCHLISKYHADLLSFGAHAQDTLQFRDEIKTLRLQIYGKISQALDKMTPHMDQISKNTESEMYTSAQQLIGYLEFLKLEFNRNMYLLLSFPIDTLKSTIEFEFSDAYSSSLVAMSPINGDTSKVITHTLDPLTQHRNEIKSIRRDLKEIEVRLYYLSQKFSINALGGHNFKSNPSETLYKPKRKKKSASSKLRLLCCFWSQTYM